MHEGHGFLFGQEIAVSHVGRTDIFEDEDVPVISQFPTEEHTKSAFYTKGFDGRKVYRVMAELWKYDWIHPAKKSSIVLGQGDRVRIFYTVDAEGKKKTGESLKAGGRWLWFKPELVLTLLSKRGGYLSWYTKDTGSIACGPGGGVHFGLNELGLVTVYAKDVGNLPSWQQQIWAAFNIPPEGGISKELHSAQIKAEPTKTLPPESFIIVAIEDTNKAALKQFGIKIFREHQSIKQIIPTIHRFRATDEKGLFSLAKDIARVIIDDINAEEIQKIAPPPKGQKLGSLKTIEQLLAIRIPQENARKLLSPLVGVYELRHGDAHLPSRENAESFNLIGIDRTKPYLVQGYQMLYACVDHLHIIMRLIQRW